MSRKITTLLWLCLLCMLPCLTWAQTLTRYEYWFDDDFGGKVSGSLSGTDKVFKSSISTDQLDNGVHKFSFRAKQSDGKYSAITSSLFLKRPAAQSTVMEYWFDDNIEQRESISIGSTEEEQEMTLDLQDNSKYPMGFHKLNMRLNIEGEGMSAIYSADVIKLAAGKPTKLEYWIDNDRAHSKTVSGKTATGGYLFTSQLDLSGVTPGYHLLHCRAVSSSKRTVSAVTTTPIMVKLREYGDETVVKYTVSIDNADPVAFNVKEPDSIVTIPYTLDARGLQEGKQHRLDMKIYNSLGTSVTTTETFLVNPAEEPVITLNARDDRGFIHLQFNSIPNDFKYKVYRKRWMDDVVVCIPTYHDHNYPNTNYYLDMPLAGTYDYEVEGIWKDYYGTEHSVRSNKVRITTDGSQTANQYGSIEGIVRIKGKQLSQLPPDMILDVNFSDGEKVRVQDNGAFYRANVPLGSTLTMTLADITTDGIFSPRTYSFDVQTATVTEEQPIAHVVFEGVQNTDTDMIDDYGYSELSISSSLSCTDTSFSFDVTNISGRTWTGTVYLKAVKKSDLGKYDHDSGFNWGSSFSFTNFDSFFDLGSTYVSQLANGKTRELNIEFNGIPFSDKDEEYYVFIVSSETGRARLQLLSTDVADVNNPKLWTLPSTVWTDDSRPFIESEVNSYLADIFECMDALQKVDGPLKKVLDQIAYQLDTYDETYYNGDGMFGNLPELCRNFGEDLVNAVKDVSNITDELKRFKSFCDKAQQIYKLANLTEVDSYTLWHEAMKATIKAYEAYGGPLAGIYMLYLDATDKAVEFIDRIGKKLYEFYGGEHFYDGVTKFNLIVRKKNPILEKKNFKAENVARMIKSVTITCKAPNTMTRTYYPESNPSGRQLELVPGEWIEHYMYDQNPPKEFYMVIIWKNDRVTKVPLGKDIVNIHAGQSVSEITVTLQSGSNDWDEMANKIRIITQLEELNTSTYE